MCIPPGQSGNRLLVYDLNKIDDSSGRDVPVADGVNFQSITLHKVVVGGEPEDVDDLRNWPGCVLVNVAKLKIHAVELFTGAVKNLGIGLYPLEAPAVSEKGKFAWKYAMPSIRVPTVKTGAPHSRWVIRYDEDTGIPLKDGEGNYKIFKTGGLEASMVDVIKAVKGAGVRMIHIVDAIEATNLNHFTVGCTPVPEGLLFVGNDMVALDSCASRYLFNMVPMEESERIQKEHNLHSDVIQRIPLAVIEGNNIVTKSGYDSPFSRYDTLEYGEGRGLGKQKFHVVGKDLWKERTGFFAGAYRKGGERHFYRIDYLYSLSYSKQRAVGHASDLSVLSGE